MPLEGKPRVLLEALRGASSPDLGKGVRIREGFLEELMLLRNPKESWE